jgi:hypothetical protein
MTVQRFLIIMTATTMICWVAVTVILWKIDPFTASISGFLLLYLSIFFALWGSIGILGFCIRYAIRRHVPAFQYVGISLRQSLWFAVLICLTLFLLSQQLFDWWMSIPLIIGFASIEGFFLSRDTQHQRVTKRTERPFQPETVPQE